MDNPVDPTSDSERSAAPQDAPDDESADDCPAPRRSGLQVARKVILILGMVCSFGGGAWMYFGKGDAMQGGIFAIVGVFFLLRLFKIIPGG